MPDDTSKDTSPMTHDERKKANEKTVEKLLKLQDDIEERTESQTKRV